MGREFFVPAGTDLAVKLLILWNGRVFFTVKVCKKLDRVSSLFYFFDQDFGLGVVCVC
jgi:hypothetical protein